MFSSEPLGMNFLLAKLGGTIDEPRGEFPLRIRGYIYEAKEAVNYAKINGLKELHIVVGCTHELPLEYFLKNVSISAPI
jgi:hypothetical protein